MQKEVSHLMCTSITLFVYCCNYYYLTVCIQRRQWKPTPVFLPRESRGQRSLVGFHGVAQNQTRLKRLSMHACIGEGNGNPLQYSCLENPRDTGARWAAVYGVAQSWTRLKWLRSSSSMHAETEV